MIDWSAVSAIGTVTTGLVIAVTVIVGFHQLKLTRVQLEQLRRATQLDGAMKIFDDLQSPRYTDARRFVAMELPKRLEDPVFRREVELGIIWTRNPETIHQEQVVLRTFETIGSNARHGLLDREVVVNVAAIAIIVAWEHLREIIEIQRRTIHPRMWEDFEQIHDDAVSWFVARGGNEQYEAWRAGLTSYVAGPT
jgi:hypothetical protein